MSFAALAAAQPAASGDWNVAKLGATNDGKTLNTAVIQKAIDDCSKSGGGTLYFPPGAYLTGTLNLRDNVTLYLEAGAVLLGSTRIEDYAPAHVIQAKGAKNIGLAGPGTIDGQGQAFWIKVATPGSDRRRKYSWVPHFAYQHGPRVPGKLILLEDCRGVKIRDITLRGSESWTLHLLGCEDVSIRGLRIRNPLHGPNTDGIDIDACSNVAISDSDIYTADDAICLKNENRKYWNRPCKNITVTNCILTTVCNAFKIGTGTHGDFQNIVFGNSIIKAGEPTDELAKESVETIDPEHYGNALAPLSGIAIETVDGGHVRGVAVSNIVMKGVRAPIFVRLGNRGGRGPDKVKDPKPGTLQDVAISNIIAYGSSTPSSITGLPGHPVQNVWLENIQVTALGGGSKELAGKQLPELETAYPEATMWGPMSMYGLFCRHAEGVKMRNVRIVCQQPDQRPMLICDDVAGLRITGLETDSNAAGDSLVRLTNVRDAIIRETTPPPGTKTWVDVSGPQSKEIQLIPDSLSGVQTPLKRSDDVPKDAVKVLAK